MQQAQWPHAKRGVCMGADAFPTRFLFCDSLCETSLRHMASQKREEHADIALPGAQLSTLLMQLHTNCVRLRGAAAEPQTAPWHEWLRATTRQTRPPDEHRVASPKHAALF